LIKTCEYVLSKFSSRFGKRDLASVSQEEVLDFLFFLTIQNPKSGRPEERVYVPRKILVRLNEYVKSNDFSIDDRIFPISYVAAWSMVKKAGKLVDIELKPHDLRRHAATYASRSGTPIEIVSKVILRHADLSTTQRYLGKVDDTEAIRWIETLYG